MGKRKGRRFCKTHVSYCSSSKLIISSSSSSSNASLSPSLSLSLSILLGLFMFDTVDTRYAASMGSAS